MRFRDSFHFFGRLVVRNLEAGRMEQQASKATNSWHFITVRVYTGACSYGTGMYGVNVYIYIYIIIIKRVITSEPYVTILAQTPHRVGD